MLSLQVTVTLATYRRCPRAPFPFFFPTPLSLVTSIPKLSAPSSRASLHLDDAKTLEGTPPHLSPRPVPRGAAPAMAEPALLDPSPFDLRHYPAHLFDPDLPLAGGDLPLGGFAGDDGLDFDLPADFSVDDFLLRSPDRGGEGDDSGEGSAAGSGPAASTSASPVTSAANSAMASAGDREVKHEDSDEGRSGAAPSEAGERWSELGRGQVPPIRRRRAFPVPAPLDSSSGAAAGSSGAAAAGSASLDTAGRHDAAAPAVGSWRGGPAAAGRRSSPGFSFFLSQNFFANFFYCKIFFS